jgi:hypothetical protein
MRDEDGTSEDTGARAGQGGSPAEAIAPILAEAASRVIDILRTQGRGRFEGATRWTRRRLELSQASRDIESLYNKLGRELVCLVEAGEVAHPGLVKRAERIRAEEERFEAARQAPEAPLRDDVGEE